MFAQGLEFNSLFRFVFPLVCSQTQTNIKQSKQSAFPLVQWEEIGTAGVLKKKKKQNWTEKLHLVVFGFLLFMRTVAQTFAAGVKECPCPPGMKVAVSGAIEMTHVCSSPLASVDLSRNLSE